LFRLDCSRAVNKRRLLQLFSDALGFPAWFGQNWDALADALADIAVDDEGWVLLLNGLDRLILHAPRDAACLLDILTDTAAFWDEQGVRRYVLLAGVPREKVSEFAGVRIT
jgi:hypothetical protein